MNAYKPSTARQAVIMCSMFALVLPAIALSGMSYMYFLEHVLCFDMNESPANLVEGLKGLLVCAPIIVVMFLSVLVAGILWMFIMSKVLPWPDLMYYTKMEGPRYPWLSDFLDHLWNTMLKQRKDGDAQQFSEPYK